MVLLTSEVGQPMCSSLTHLQSAVLAENGEGGLFVNVNDFLVQVWGSWNSFRVPWEGNMTEMSCLVPLAKEKLHPEGEGGWFVCLFIVCSRTKIMLSISESLFVSSWVWKTKDKRGDSSPHFS